MKTLVKMNFDPEIAKLYGVNSAIIYENIKYWIWLNYTRQVDKEVQPSFQDGRWWTFNSAKAYERQFTWLTDRQIQGAIEKLKKGGLIVTGNYNKNKYDKTTWYALEEKAFTHLRKSIYEDKLIEKQEQVNRKTEESEPIPNNNTNDNTDLEKSFGKTSEMDSFKAKAIKSKTRLPSKGFGFSPPSSRQTPSPVSMKYQDFESITPEVIKEVAKSNKAYQEEVAGVWKQLQTKIRGGKTEKWLNLREQLNSWVIGALQKGWIDKKLTIEERIRRAGYEIIE